MQKVRPARRGDADATVRRRSVQQRIPHLLPDSALARGAEVYTLVLATLKLSAMLKLYTLRPTTLRLYTGDSLKLYTLLLATLKLPAMLLEPLSLSTVDSLQLYRAAARDDEALVRCRSRC